MAPAPISCSQRSSACTSRCNPGARAALARPRWITTGLSVSAVAVRTVIQVSSPRFLCHWRVSIAGTDQGWGLVDLQPLKIKLRVRYFR